MKAFEELWKDLEENFKWEKVKNTMDLLDWKWAEYDGVPNTVQIIRQAKSLCEACYNKSKRGGKRSHRRGTGGLYAEYSEHYDQPEPHNELTLEFVLESFSVW